MTDPSIPILTNIQFMISNKTNILAGPTVHEQYNFRLFKSKKPVTILGFWNSFKFTTFFKMILRNKARTVTLLEIWNWSLFLLWPKFWMGLVKNEQFSNLNMTHHIAYFRPRAMN